MRTHYYISRRDFMQIGAMGAAGLSLGFKTNPTANRPIAPSDKITVGMISAGARAHQLMENLKQIPEVEIVAVCDAYKGRIQRAISRTGGSAKAYADYREIIEQSDIDAVVISTPDHLHVRQAVDAMNAGKHIYLEKPMTYTVDEGLEIMEAAKRNGVAVQIGSSVISSLAAKKARELVAAGKLGQVTMVRAYNNRNTASGAWIYPIPPDASAETVNWDMFQGDAPRRPMDLARFFRWRCFRDYSGGISTDLFVHQCTTINYLMSADMCDSVIAMGGLYRWKNSRDVPDAINASLAYPEGFMASLSCTLNNQGGGGAGIQILGTEGTLTVGGSLSFQKEIVHEGNGWIVDSWPEQLAEAYYQDEAIRAEELPQTQPQRLIPEAEIYTTEGIPHTTAHFLEFFEAVRNGTPTKEDAVVGHHAASCAHMINLSIDSGKMVHWDKSKETVAP